MQPTFNPWIGYFDLIDYVDLFVFLDTVQLNQQSWQTRNKIKINGTESIFSIPIAKTKHKQELLIKDATIDTRKFDFRKKLKKSIFLEYKKAKYFATSYPLLEEMINYQTESLSKYNINIITAIAKKMGIETEIVTTSQLEKISEATKEDLVLDICEYFNAKQYVSPIGAKEYLEHGRKKFDKKNIEILYQIYHHPAYNQLGDTFIPYIGIFDLILNEGFERSMETIRSGRDYLRDSNEIL
jgi:hypothetical protein